MQSSDHVPVLRPGFWLEGNTDGTFDYTAELLDASDGDGPRAFFEAHIAVGVFGESESHAAH